MATTSGQQRLEEAVNKFKTVLKPEDRLSLVGLSKPSAEDVVNLVKDIESRLKTKQKRRKVVQNAPFQNFIQSMQQFSNIVDTCVQSNPEIAALVWGGLKFVLLGFTNYLKYLEEITDMCEEMGRLCPQYEKFAKLFPKYGDLQSCVCDFYAIVVGFFGEALSFLYSSAIKQFVVATFQPFRDKFSEILKSLSVAKGTLENEIQFSSERELYNERLAAAQARIEAKDFYALARIAYHDYRTDHLQLVESNRKLKHERIVDNICSHPYYFDFSNNIQKRVEGSCRWIFDRLEYKFWFGSDNSAGLWYYAIPGFGKSVLAASIIDRCLEISKSSRQKYFISYFLCTHSNPSSLVAHTIISSILQQFVYYSDSLPSSLAAKLENHFQDRPSASRVTTSILQSLLVELLTQNGSENFIILDGLDECNDKERGIVLRILVGVFKTVPKKLRILISSRNAPDISRSLKDFQQIDLESGNKDDIEFFIEESLRNKQIEGQLPDLAPGALKNLKKALSQNAKGLFIWVDLQIEDICNEVMLNGIEITLRDLPKNLDELYERILKRIVERRNPEIASSIFTWVAYAVRPLSLAELKEAVALSDPDIPNWSALVKKTIVDDPKWLQNCENLIYWNKQSQTIGFLHSSVKEYLESDRLSDKSFQLLPTSHQLLASQCTRYFSLPDIDQTPPESHQTSITERNAEAFKWLPQSMFPSTSWSEWLAGRVYNHKSTQRPKSKNIKVGNSSKALIQASNGLVVLQRASFKQLLHTHPFLEYATSNWANHENEYILASHRFQETAIEIDEDFSTSKGRRILELMNTKHHTIRFPWQNYFSHSSYTNQFDDAKLMADWAISQDNVMVVILLPAKTNDKYHKFHNSLWFEGISPGIWHEPGQSKTRFELICRRPNQQRWRLARKILFPSVNPDGSAFWTWSPFYSSVAVRSALLCDICTSGDLKLLRYIMEVISRNPDIQMGEEVTVSKTFPLQTYTSMMMGAINGNQPDILMYLLSRSFREPGERLQKQPKDSFEILRHAVRLERADLFERLMTVEMYQQSIDYSQVGTGPTVLQLAASIGNIRIFQACQKPLSLTDPLYHGKSQDKLHPLRPIQLAAKHRHFDIVKVILDSVSTSTRRRLVADVGAGDPGPSALTYATMNQDTLMISLLLDAGAKLAFEETSREITTADPSDSFLSPLEQLVKTPSVEIWDLYLNQRKFDISLGFLELNKRGLIRTDPWRVITELSDLNMVQCVTRIQILEILLLGVQMFRDARFFAEGLALEEETERTLASLKAVDASSRLVRRLADPSNF